MSLYMEDGEVKDINLGRLQCLFREQVANVCGSFKLFS